jgi:hypothetical protein
MVNLITSFFVGNFIYPLIIPGFLAGCIAILLSVFMPSLLTIYKMPVMLGGILLVLFFTFYGGKYTQEQSYKIENAELIAKVAEYKTESGKVTTVVETKYVDKVRVIEKIKIQYKDVYVDKFITKEDDDRCVINNGFVVLHNQAASGNLPGTPSVIDATATKVKLSDVGKVVTGNYLTYNQVAEQLLSLQEWVTKQKELVSKTK